MSINVYWKEEEIRKREDFKVDHRSNKDGQRWDEYRLNNIYISSDGRMHSTVHDLNVPLPAWMEGLYSELSSYEWFSIEPGRKRGVYNLRSARAEVDVTRGERDRYHTVRLVGQKLSDMHELYCLVRSGRILPSESWEAEQMTTIQSIVGHLKDIFQLLLQKVPVGKYRPKSIFQLYLRKFRP